jgi:hypothetical protein
MRRIRPVRGSVRDSCAASGFVRPRLHHGIRCGRPAKSAVGVLVAVQGALLTSVVVRFKGCPGAALLQ